MYGIFLMCDFLRTFQKNISDEWLGRDQLITGAEGEREISQAKGPGQDDAS